MSLDEQYKPIDDALETEFNAHLPIISDKNEIVSSNNEEKIDKDYGTVRRNLYDL